MIGRFRYETGFAGSGDVRIERRRAIRSLGGENDSSPFAWKYNFSGAEFRGGHESSVFQVLDPVSNTVTGGSVSVPFPFSQYANHGA